MLIVTLTYTNNNAYKYNSRRHVNSVLIDMCIVCTVCSGSLVGVVMGCGEYSLSTGPGPMAKAQLYAHQH